MMKSPHCRGLVWVSKNFPQFWGRNAGKDHFVWITGDVGACWLLDEPIVQNAIKITHWGLQVCHTLGRGFRFAGALQGKWRFTVENCFCIPGWRCLEG